MNEPSDLADIIQFPSPTSTPTQTCTVSLTDPLVNTIVLAGFAANVDGWAYGNITNELRAEGVTTTGPPYWLSTSDQCVDFAGYVNSNYFSGAAMGWWTNSFGSSGNLRALFVWAYDTQTHTDIVLSVVTNLLPPNELTSGYKVANAMPYIYANFTFFAGAHFGNPSPREVSYYYWQYSSAYNPNWFWGVYLWWRFYLLSYSLKYEPWFWWFWHWYYTEFWYYWGTSFPYQ
jgi:hypothetical protein